MLQRIVLLSGLLFLMASCGPSQEELEREQRIEDSLMEIERIDIIAKANQALLGDSTVGDSTVIDTVQ